MAKSEVLHMGREGKVKVQREMHVETVKRFEIKITADLIREMLKGHGVLVPPGARVQFVVPGGGDWSNTAIDIDEEHPVLVDWSTTEVK